MRNPYLPEMIRRESGKQGTRDIWLWGTTKNFSDIGTPGAFSRAILVDLDLPEPFSMVLTLLTQTGGIDYLITYGAGGASRSLLITGGNRNLSLALPLHASKVRVEAIANGIGGDAVAGAWASPGISARPGVICVGETSTLAAGGTATLQAVGLGTPVNFAFGGTYPLQTGRLKVVRNPATAAFSMLPSSGIQQVAVAVGQEMEWMEIAGFTDWVITNDSLANADFRVYAELEM